MKIIIRHALVLAFTICNYIIGANASVVGPEVPILPTFAPAPGNHSQVQLAASPNGYFAVWADTRNTNLDAPYNTKSDIFGCRISLTGQILDVMGISISTAADDQVSPAVEWNGSMYLVVWTDRRSPIRQIYAARILPSGEVLDKQGIPLSVTSADQAYPRVASDGSCWVVVWQDNRGSSTDVYGCKVSSDGIVTKASGLAAGTGNEELPDIAWNGSSYFLVWDNGSDIYGSRVSKAGSRLSMSDILVSNNGTSTTPATGNQLNVRICQVGTSNMAVWEDYRNSSSACDIYGTLISSSGTVSIIGGKAVCKLTDDQLYPSVSYNGTNILVAWRDSATFLTKGARLSSTATLLDSSPINISVGMANKTGLSVRGNQGSFAVGWSSLDAVSAQARINIVSNSGSISLSDTCVSTAVEDRPYYCVIDDGTNYVMVWPQIVNGSWDILGAKISRSGVILTTTPINLTSWIAGDQTQPSIAWNGTRYLLLWRGNESFVTTDWDIRGCFFDQNLVRIGTTALSIGTAQNEQAWPYVTSNGNNFLAVWEDSKNAVSPSYYTDISGAIVTTTNSVTATSPDISLSTGDQHKPKAVSNGTNYFVVWEDERSTGNYPLVRGTRVTSTGTVQDTSGIAFPATSYYQTLPAICYGNGNYFVVWSDYYKITGTRVSTAGAILDSAGIAIDSSSSTLKLCPGVCWDGSKYQVVWEDYRSSFSGNSDIYQTTVNSTGGPVTDLKTALVSDMVSQFRPRIFASSSSSSGRLFYLRFFNYANTICTSSLTDQGVQEVPSISAAKNLPAGTIVHLQGKIVTVTGSGFFYIQETNRCSGIKVLSNLVVSRNQMVDIVGTVGISDGERYISAGAMNVLGAASTPPKPIAMRGDVLGGGPLNSYTPGITGAIGLNNIGLLVTTWGKVLSTTNNGFYIEAKPNLNIKVLSGSLTKPTVNSFVTITGISTCEIVSSSTGRAILPRDQNDIRIIK